MKLFFLYHEHGINEFYVISHILLNFCYHFIQVFNCTIIQLDIMITELFRISDKNHKLRTENESSNYTVMKLFQSHYIKH